MSNQLHANSRSAISRGFKPFYMLDPNADANYFHRIVDNSSKGLFFGTTVGHGIVLSRLNHVIGSGLVPASSPESNVLPPDCTQEVRDRFVRKVDALWRIYAGDKSMCDFYGEHTFGELQRIAYVNRCFSDCLHYHPVRIRNARTTVLNQIISGACVCNRDNNSDTKDCIAGVEIRNGKPDGYWVQQSDDYLNDTTSWIRIPRYDRNGWTVSNLIHIDDTDGIQRRGRGIFESCKETVLALIKYCDNEGVAKAIKALFPFFLEKELDNNDTSAKTTFSEKLSTITEDESENSEIIVGTGAVCELNPGEKMHAIESMTPGTAFPDYVSMMLNIIGSATLVPKQMLLSLYDSSYSASQATIQDADKAFSYERKMFANQFCDDVRSRMIDIWVSEGLVQAPHYNETSLYRSAWNACSWRGPSATTIDLLKLVNSLNAAVDMNIMTKEDASLIFSGKDATEVFERRKNEEEQEQKLGIKKTATPKTVQADKEEMGETDGSEMETEDDK